MSFESSQGTRITRSCSSAARVQEMSPRRQTERAFEEKLRPFLLRCRVLEVSFAQHVMRTAEAACHFRPLYSLVLCFGPR